MLAERLETSAGSEPAFVFPARRGRMRLALTPTRVVATSVAGTVELPWKAVGRAPRSTAPCSASPPPGPGPRCGRAGAGSGRLNQRVTPYAVSFKAAAFADEAEDVVRAIERYRATPAAAARSAATRNTRALLAERA